MENIKKSIRRHALKQIDKKWAGKKVEGPAHHKALEKSKHISHSFKTYGDEGTKKMGSFESRLDKYAKSKENKL